MSSSGLAAEIAYQLELGFVQNYCMVAMAALVLYEHAITFSQEVDLIWTRKKTGATVLYIMNRCCTIGLALAMILLLPNWSTSTSCEAVNLLLPIFQLALAIVWAAFSATRVYAIGGRAWQLAIVTFALGLVPVGLNLFSDIRYVYTTAYIPSFGTVCNNIPLFSTSTNVILLCVARASLITSDLIVLTVTWVKTYRIKQEAVEANMKTTTVTLLLRDGTFYFIVLLVINVLHLTLSLTNVFSDVTYFSTAMSSVIVSRFLLNLRQVHMEDNYPDEQPSFVGSTSRISDVRFASTVVGNLGAPLDYSSTFFTNGDVESQAASHNAIDTGYSDVEALGELDDVEPRGDIESILTNDFSPVAEPDEP